MRMVRGRSGGLGVTRPSLPHTAAALATYLRAIECTPEQTLEMSQMFATLMIRATLARGGGVDARQSGETLRHWLARLSGEPALLLCAATVDGRHDELALGEEPGRIDRPTTRERPHSGQL